MTAIVIPEPREAREALGIANAWPEATIVANPVKGAKPGMKPKVLVQRNINEYTGPNNEQMFYLPGPSAISLFTGVGGMDLGSEQAGFCVLAQHELDGFCCETLIENRPDYFRHAALMQGDLCETATSFILEAAGLRVGECNLICGGPPCQGFSTAGRRDPKDVRNKLVFEFLRVIREAQPSYFAMENVPGMVSMEKGQVLQEFLETAHQGYYELVYGLVNACEYGVPQDRTRLFVMGTRRDLMESEGKLACLPAPQCFNREAIDFMDFVEKRPLLTSESRPEIEDIRTVFGIRYLPGRKYIKPVKPLMNRDGRTLRSPGYARMWRKLQRDEPERLVIAGRDVLNPQSLEHSDP